MVELMDLITVPKGLQAHAQPAPIAELPDHDHHFRNQMTMACCLLNTLYAYKLFRKVGPNLYLGLGSSIRAHVESKPLNKARSRPRVTTHKLMGPILCLFISYIYIHCIYTIHKIN